MPAGVPLATYRVQLTARFGFDQAAETIPYLQALGISHLYASPFLKARAGSNHGYDVVDYGSLNPEARRRSGVRTAVQRPRSGGDRLILDSCPTTWLCTTPTMRGGSMSWSGGPSSRTPIRSISIGAFFPPSAGSAPDLGGPYGQVLDKGEIELRYDATEGSFSAWYYEHRLPIAPGPLRRYLRTSVCAGRCQRHTIRPPAPDLAARSQGADSTTPHKRKP